jgi:hypothetical protein
MPTPYVRVAPASSASNVPLVVVRGTGGVLMGVGVAGGICYHSFRLTIDGSVLADDFVVGSNTGAGNANGGVTMSLPFEQELKVEIRDDPTPSAITRFWTTFFTWHSEPISGPDRHVERIDGQEFLFQRTDFADAEGREYTIDELIGPRRWSYIELSADTFLATEEEYARGTLRLRGWRDVEPLSLDGAQIAVRPAGRQRTLWFGSRPIEAEGRFQIPLGELPQRVLLEAVADIKGFANVPASFVVL